MAVDTVVVAQNTDDAALRPSRRSLIGVALGQHDDAVSLGQLQRHREAGKPGTDDYNRGLCPIRTFE
jgi:hypothetical protein